MIPGYPGTSGAETISYNPGMQHRLSCPGVIRFVALLMCLAGLLAAQNSRGKDSQPQDDTFSDEIAARLLDQVRQGLEANDPDLMLSAFDSSKMPDFPAFRDQVRSMFQKYEEFRVDFHITQTWTEDGRGIVVVDFELQATPQGGEVQPVHNEAQLRFEMARGQQGWKIVDLSPREFFS